ncbi:hypothetical protein BDF20DRAFT_916581 [Mycotypha africana]|uniref:uncharacterized protein n=1 Tax=Mycotypha africana TaxID=64632 RepID=UPI0023015806|nr:uncharacterized protein BDF20DRAFT_916581 [Mycotypha africana]KAI8969205.1 hypothetical protein BDF20DRAFT_916581 [Mycotypha africana]
MTTSTEPQDSLHTMQDDNDLHPLATSTRVTSSVSDSPAESSASSTISSPPLTAVDKVTTIFVVGFPDDMQEREFQNMFLFSKGFEGASLKWHCKEQQDDQDLVSFNNMNKKQMIGFAKFHTRKEAMDAANQMNGKKVDMEKGSILKAEMAKKNLHIKRNSSIPTTSISTPYESNLQPSASLFLTPDLPTSQLAAQAASPRRLSQPQPQQKDLLSPFSAINDNSCSGLEGFSPLPSDLLSPADYKNDPLLNDPLLPTSDAPSFGEPLFGIRSQSFDGQNLSSKITTSSTAINSKNDILHPFNFFSKSFNITDDNDPFSYLSKSTPSTNNDFFSTLSCFQPQSNTGLFGADDFLSISNRRCSLQPPSAVADLTFKRSASVSSSSGRPSTNPADQNPPCNTLYVGNLPPTTSEDELRSLFSHCEGYKRMCFRQKPQGPMCFVEFEDVLYAAMAMTENQGHLLSSSIKGGIRLSFSKNPLFIKPNKDNKDNNNNLTSHAFNFKQLGTALLADA